LKFDPAVLHALEDARHFAHGAETHCITRIAAFGFGALESSDEMENCKPGG